MFPSLIIYSLYCAFAALPSGGGVCIHSSPYYGPYLFMLWWAPLAECTNATRVLVIHYLILTNFCIILQYRRSTEQVCRLDQVHAASSDSLRKVRQLELITSMNPMPLSHVEICWNLLICVDMCWNLLTRVEMCWNQDLFIVQHVSRVKSRGLADLPGRTGSKNL